MDRSKRFELFTLADLQLIIPRMCRLRETFTQDDLEQIYTITGYLQRKENVSVDSNVRRIIKKITATNRNIGFYESRWAVLDYPNALSVAYVSLFKYSSDGACTVLPPRMQITELDETDLYQYNQTKSCLELLCSTKEPPPTVLDAMPDWNISGWDFISAPVFMSPDSDISEFLRLRRNQPSRFQD